MEPRTYDKTVTSKQRDETQEKSGDEVTKKDLHKITSPQANAICNSYLTFTSEVENNYSWRYMPTLNLQIRMIEIGQITDKFFKKEM